MSDLSRTHETFIQTRYCESDALGHINSVSFFIYIEEARVKFLTDSNIVNDVNEEWPFILASSKCDYKKQVYINEKLKVRTVVSHIGNTSFSLKHLIYRDDSEELLAVGESIIVYYDFNKESNIPIKNKLQNKLKVYKILK